MAAITVFEIGLILLAIVGIGVAYYLFKMAKGLAVNAVVGLVVLLVAHIFGVGVQVTPVVVLVVAFGGLPASLVILVLGNLGVIFTPALISTVI